jgi:glycosyltransferase involved in cell wall biosynthesis
MEIGPVILPFLGSQMGGSHVLAFTLGQSLMSEFGVRCIVLAAAGSLIAREAAKLGFEVAPTGERPARRRHNPMYDLARLPFRLRTLKRYGDKTIVHCNDIESLQSWGTVAKMAGMPVVYHHQALNRMVLPNKLLVKMADAVICVSDRCRRSVAFLPDTRCFTQFNPFSLASDTDGNAVRAEFLRRHGLSPDAVLIGFIANFWSRKRPQFFLDVCRAVSRRNDRARFVIFGRDGDYTQNQLSDYARGLGIGDRTVFAGFRLPAETNVAMLNLLVAPALNEPFGRTLVEALLLGVPYVATADGGHIEISSRWGGGELVDSQATAEQFAEATVSALGRRDAIALPSERRMQVGLELSPKSQAEKVVTIYRRIRNVPDGEPASGATRIAAAAEADHLDQRHHP